MMRFVLPVTLLFILAASCIHCKKEKSVSSTPPPLVNCDDLTSLVVSGKFMNKNVYFMNAFCNCGDTAWAFSTREVIINDSIRMKKDEINSSAYEIPLTDYGFKPGDSIRIKVIYPLNCSRPKMLNPEVR